LNAFCEPDDARNREAGHLTKARIVPAHLYRAVNFVDPTFLVERLSDDETSAHYNNGYRHHRRILDRR
jgi:hypothetical protein